MKKRKNLHKPWTQAEFMFLLFSRKIPPFYTKSGCYRLLTNTPMQYSTRNIINPTKLTNKYTTKMLSKCSIVIFM